jgi:hypothetical protein
MPKMEEEKEEEEEVVEEEEGIHNELGFNYIYIR